LNTSPQCPDALADQQTIIIIIIIVVVIIIIISSSSSSNSIISIIIISIMGVTVIAISDFDSLCPFVWESKMLKLVAVNTHVGPSP